MICSQVLYIVGIVIRAELLGNVMAVAVNYSGEIMTAPTTQ